MRANPTLQVVDLIRLDAKFLYAAEQRNFTADKGIVAEFVCRRISRDPASQGSTRVLKFWAFAGSGGDYSMAAISFRESDMLPNTSPCILIILMDGLRIDAAAAWNRQSDRDHDRCLCPYNAQKEPFPGLSMIGSPGERTSSGMISHPDGREHQRLFAGRSAR